MLREWFSPKETALLAYRIGPKTGFDARTTTAFCTVDRVTSASFTSRSALLICRLHLHTQISVVQYTTYNSSSHDMPKIVLGFGEVGTRWKYE